MQKDRYLKTIIQKIALDRYKMAFISGPRQAGKTTLAKSFRSSFDQFQYFNWDESLFRKLWIRSPNQVQENFNLARFNESRLLVLDEIHKSKGWKQKLKGIYDELGDQISIAVTGSARLNIYKKGSDSLMGRYLNFRLHPFTLGELRNPIKTLEPDQWLKMIQQKPTAQNSPSEADEKILKRLNIFSGFPEPYLANSIEIRNVWRQGRNEKIIREDLRDLSRLPELSQIEMLTSMLPEKIGSPLSVQSLREDLEVSHPTVSRWLKYLNELYYFFHVKPWSKSISRSLKKEGKIYLYDWTEIENEGARFENIIACHLLKACQYWTDTGKGLFELHYIRTKDKNEIDFLITQNKKAWVCIETKLSDTEIDFKTWERFSKQIQTPLIQVVQSSGIWWKPKTDVNAVVTSASFFLRNLP